MSKRSHLQLLLRLCHDQRGAIAVIFAILFPVLIGMVALGFETGSWFATARQNQSAADIAAYSGALEIAENGNCATGWSSCPAAKTDALTNGFDVTQAINSASTLTVTKPGGISTVTVLLDQQQTPPFLSTPAFTITRKAVAQVLNVDSCLAGVATSGTTLKLTTGSSTISMPGCTITSISTDPNSIDIKNATVTAYSIDTVGGINNGCSAGGGVSLTVPPACGVALTDPYASVAVATSPANLTTFAMPALPSSATTFPSGASIATPTTQPATLGGTAPGTGAGTGCVAAPIINSTRTINSGVCYNTAFTIPSPFVVTFSNASGNGKFNFNAGLTVNSGARVVFQNGGANPLAVTVTASPFNVGGSATFNSGNYGFSNGLIAQPSSAMTFNAGGAYNITNGAAFQIGGTATFANSAATSYEFYTNGLTINNGATATFSGTDAAPAKIDLKAGNLSVAGTLNLNPGAYFLEAGNLTSTGTVNFVGADSLSKYALRASSFSLGGPVTFSATAPLGVAFYGGAVTFGSGSAISFPATNYCFAVGALTISRNVSFLNPGSGSTTIEVPAGNISTPSGTTLTFNDSSSSIYKINTGGAHGATFGGSTTFGSGTYYFLNYADSSTPCNAGGASTGGTGVTLNGNASLGGGVYSIKNGGFTVASGTTSTFSSGTTCAATPAGSCLYIANGPLSNAGTATFANGTYYIYEPGGSGSFTNSGTLNLGSTGTNTFYVNNPSGAFTNSGNATFGTGTYFVWDSSGGFKNTGTLTFTGGSGSNYYFIDPSGGGNTTLDIAGNSTAVFNPATYYIVNGDLEVDSGATLTCPNCVIGGAGDTFVLTGTGNAAALATNTGHLNIQDPTATLSAPGTGTYAGLLFFQDRNASGAFSFAGNSANCKSGNCNNLVGSNAMDLTGAIYLPQGAVGFQGGKSSGNCLVLMDAETVMAGSSSLTSDGCTSAGVQTVVTHRVALTQ